jgi:hypothetical protein
MGRGGRDNRAPQARPRQQQQPYGRPAPYGQQAPYGRQAPYGYPPQAPGQPYPPQGAPYAHGNGGAAGGYGRPGGEPEYFDNGYAGRPQAHDPYAADNPGNTRAFSVGEDPYAQVQAPPPPIGPPLHWKDLLKGIVLHPDHTFLRMRDYRMWGPAFVVTFLYGLLAVFGFSGARDEAINATLSTAIPIVLITAVAMVLSAFVLGVVTHTVARQLGGIGAWQPTVGLSMLIMAITDAPRLIFAMFLSGGETFVQVLGWATWVACAALLTRMVSRSHDLPWPKALAASAIQLIAVLSIVKLGTF